MPTPAGTWWPTGWVAPPWKIYDANYTLRTMQSTGIADDGKDYSGSRVEGQFTKGTSGFIWTKQDIPGAPAVPAPTTPPTVSDEALALLRFLRQPTDDLEIVAQAQACIGVVTAMVDGYTRGNSNRPGVGEVITAASARLFANPDGLPFDSGSYSIRGSFNGFTLPELAILNRYRKRAT